MKTLPKNIKIVKVKTNLTGTVVPKQKRGNEGNTGRHIHGILGIGGHKGPDIPKIPVEVKTRKKSSKAPHTVGTMTTDDILKSPWEDTNFASKCQHVQELIHDDTFSVNNEVTSEKLYDFTKPSIQDLLKRDYEKCRSILAANPNATGTIVGGPYGILEHKGGNTWAHRIPDSGYKKLQGMATSVFDDFFA